MDSSETELCGDKVFLCHASDGIQVVDILTGAVERKHREGRNSGGGVCLVGRSTRHLASAQADKALMLFWDRDLELPTFKAALPERLSCIAFDDAAQFMYAGGSSGRVYVWMLESGHLIKTWTGHYAAVTHVAIVGEEEVIVTAGADGVVKAYWISSIICDDTTGHSDSIPEPQVFRCWSAHTQAITAITGDLSDVFSSLLISSALDNSLRVWSWKSDCCISSFLTPAKINCLSQDSLKLTIFACCDNGSIYLIPSNAATRQGYNPTAEDLRLFPALEGHSGEVRCATVTSDGSLVSCAADGVRIWNVRKMTTLHHWPHFGSEIVAMHISSPLSRDQQRRIEKFGRFSACQISVREARSSMVISDGGTFDRRSTVQDYHKLWPAKPGNVLRIGDPMRWAAHEDIYGRNRQLYAQEAKSAVDAMYRRNYRNLLDIVGHLYEGNDQGGSSDLPRKTTSRSVGFDSMTASEAED